MSQTNDEMKPTKNEWELFKVIQERGMEKREAINTMAMLKLGNKPVEPILKWLSKNENADRDRIMDYLSRYVF